MTISTEAWRWIAKAQRSVDDANKVTNYMLRRRNELILNSVNRGATRAEVAEATGLSVSAIDHIVRDTNRRLTSEAKRSNES